jgi:hypothetical protein
VSEGNEHVGQSQVLLHDLVLGWMELGGLHINSPCNAHCVTIGLGAAFIRKDAFVSQMRRHGKPAQLAYQAKYIGAFSQVLEFCPAQDTLWLHPRRQCTALGC